MLYIQNWWAILLTKSELRESSIVNIIVIWVVSLSEVQYDKVSLDRTFLFNEIPQMGRTAGVDFFSFLYDPLKIYRKLQLNQSNYSVITALSKSKCFFILLTLPLEVQCFNKRCSLLLDIYYCFYIKLKNRIQNEDMILFTIDVQNEYMYMYITVLGRTDFELYLGWTSKKVNGWKKLAKKHNPV